MNYSFLLLASGLAATSAAYAQLGVRLAGSPAKFHPTQGRVVNRSSYRLAGYQVGRAY